MAKVRAGESGVKQRTIAVVAAGLSRPSSTTLLSQRLADATESALRPTGITVRRAVIELRPHAADLAEALVAGRPSRQVASIVTQVTEADGLIAVTPTFAASYAGLFKSFFDVLDPAALTGMPVLLGATGGSARHSLVIEYALRPLLNYFRARIVPTGVFAAAEDFDPGPAATRLDARIERAGKELGELVALPRRDDRADHISGSRDDRDRSAIGHDAADRTGRRDTDVIDHRRSAAPAR